MSFLQNRGRGGRGGGIGGGNGPLGPIIKGVAAGIGLASESVHHYRENKAAKEASSAVRQVSNTSSPPTSPPPYAELKTSRSTSEKNLKTASGRKEDDKDEDEQQWELDEAQDELVLISEQHESEQQDGEPAKRKQEHDPKKMVKHFTDAYPPSPEMAAGGLSLPVILPQRRPKDRTRGFIRAYAPALQDCGIDEPMFMDFLETFNTATLASPWIDAINLASFAFMVLPTAIGQAASIALAIAVDITKHMQSRHRHSYVLDQMNNDFYRPRGLYALILTWNPATEDASIGINLNETISQNLTKPEGLVDKTKHSFRPSMGNTNGVIFAESAPLTFPALESLTESTHHEVKTNKEKLVLTKSLVADYFDRRAQATYAGENPDSELLVAPKPKFTSRYSDPNHPSNSGDLLGLLTAGKVVMPPRGQGFGAIRSLSNRSGSGYNDQYGYDGNQYGNQYGSQYGNQYGNQYGGARANAINQIANNRRAAFQGRGLPGPLGRVGGLIGGSRDTGRDPYGGSMGSTGPPQAGMMRGMGGAGGMMGGPGGSTGGLGGMAAGGPGGIIGATVGRVLKKVCLCESPDYSRPTILTKFCSTSCTS